MPGLCFSDARLRPSPCFPPLSIGEGWSAGRRPGGLRNLLRPALRSSGLHAELPGPKSLEGGGGPGARGPLRGARAPLGAPWRHALSAAAPCSVFGCRDRRRPRLSKACRQYSGQKTDPDCCELRCEFTGDRRFRTFARFQDIEKNDYFIIVSKDISCVISNIDLSKDISQNQKGVI